MDLASLNLAHQNIHWQNAEDPKQWDTMSDCQYILILGALNTYLLWFSKDGTAEFQNHSSIFTAPSLYHKRDQLHQNKTERKNLLLHDIQAQHAQKAH